jgi:hypothetical protein
MTPRADDAMSRPGSAQPQLGAFKRSLFVILSLIGLLAIAYGIGGTALTDAFRSLLEH